MIINLYNTNTVIFWHVQVVASVTVSRTSVNVKPSERNQASPLMVISVNVTQASATMKSTQMYVERTIHKSIYC